MITYSAVIDSPMAPVAAFAYLADLTNFEDWDPGTKEAVQVGGQGPGLGSEYDLKVGMVSLHYTVQEFDEPKHLVAHGTHPLVDSTDSMTVEPTPDGSRITYEAELSTAGPLRLLDPVFNRAFQRMGDDAADGLARALDGRRTEDGF